MFILLIQAATEQQRHLLDNKLHKNNITCYRQEQQAARNLTEACLLTFPVKLNMTLPIFFTKYCSVYCK